MKAKITNAEKEIVKNSYKLLLKFLMIFKYISQTISGGTFSGLCFFFLLNITNRFNNMASLIFSLILSLMAGFFIEFGFYSTLKAFWSSLIEWKFKSILFIILFIGNTLLMLIFGSITTIGSTMAASQVVKYFDNEEEQLQKNIFQLQNANVADLNNSKNKTIEDIKKLRNKTKEMLIDDWDRKIQNDEAWATQNNIKNYKSPLINKKNEALLSFELETEKQTNLISSKHDQNFTTLLKMDSIKLQSVINKELKEYEKNESEKLELKHFLFIIVIFSSLITLILTGMQEIAAYIIRSDNTKTIFEISDVSLQENVNNYLKKNLLLIDNNKYQLTKTAKNCIRVWYRRALEDPKSLNNKRIEYTKLYLKDIIDMKFENKTVIF